RKVSLPATPAGAVAALGAATLPPGMRSALALSSLMTGRCPERLAQFPLDAPERCLEPLTDRREKREARACHESRKAHRTGRQISHRGQEEKASLALAIPLLARQRQTNHSGPVRALAGGSLESPCSLAA